MPVIKDKAVMNSHAAFIYGCTHDEALEINEWLPLRQKGTKAMAYSAQRQNAKDRGVAWEFTFPEWMSVWDDSGKWEMRGRKIGRYVMSRFGDIGPYRIGNVEITTCSANCSYARSHDIRRKTAIGIHP